MESKNPNDDAMEALRKDMIEAIEFTGTFIAAYILGETKVGVQPAAAYRYAVDAIKRQEPDKARLAGL